MIQPTHSLKHTAACGAPAACGAGASWLESGGNAGPVVAGSPRRREPVPIDAMNPGPANGLLAQSFAAI